MKYIYAVCFLLLVCGCHKENDTPVVLPARTLLVYLGGDNNLDAETYDKLVQIKNGWQDGTDGKIIVYQDTPFKDSPRLMEIDGKSEKGYITIHTYDQENSASPQVLKRVINDVTRLYPAKSYGLIVFSHGSGWLPPHTLVNGSRSIIIDNDNEMEITDFAMALPDHLFEFIIFEACNIAGIEVAYELRNKAAYIMASSAPVVSPGFTPYLLICSISCLLEEAADLQRFAENYFHYWNLMEGDKRSATISIIKTAGLSNLANLIRQINTEISGSFLPVGNLQNYDGVLKAPFYFLISLNVINHYQMKTHTMHFKSVSANVWFTKEILFLYATEEGTFPITAFSGMTTFIMQRELNDLNEEYTKLQWYKDTTTH
ncbi:clostripain-related cysteine peptidase [Phocaeicola dorei]|nr:clostripain-related cysteine peptidase [Phocaeicola dorei]